MNTLGALSALFTGAVLISYINFRYTKIQSSIAITSAAIVLSILLIISAHFGFGSIEKTLVNALTKIDFHALLMNGMLSFLLFAGALNIDLHDLRSQKWEITILAGVGTIVSCFIIAYLTYFCFIWIGHPLAIIYCLLFGALISPTDPIAVLAIFKKVGAPKNLYARLSGESLFNDGVGVVLFITLYAIAFGDTQPTPHSVLVLFIQQAAGGVLYGALLGYIGYRLIKPIDDYVLEIFITLAITTGGYALAQYLDISGPLAMVVAGIFIGNHSRLFYMSTKTRQNLDHFWELIDTGLNAILFLFIGLELNLIKVTWFEITTGVAAIIITLIARSLCVGIPMTCFKLRKRYEPYTIRIMIWGGLRGGLAIALALALPNNPERQIILPMTYAVVIFSIIVQGLSIKALVNKSKQKKHD